MNAGQSWAAAYKPGELVVVMKPFMGELSRIGLGLLTRCDIPPAGGLQIPVVEVLIFGKIIKCSLGEIRHMTPKEIKQGELGAGINEKLLDYEALNREDEETIRNVPRVGELALGNESHTDDLQNPVLVVDIKNASVVVDDESQTFYVDNHHGITWFDELPDDIPMAQIIFNGALFWLPLNWLTRIPSAS